MTKEEHLRQKIKNYVLSLFEGIEETPIKEEKEWLENCLYLFAEPREKRIAELEAQIEKMKCCSNCDNWNWKHNKCEKKLKGDCFKHSKWVMRNF